MDLLFALAHWHALGKLRQHTDLSLVLLESATIQLGKLLRDFQATTCAAYDTRELKREMAARMRQAANKSTSNKPEESDNVASTSGITAETLPAGETLLPPSSLQDLEAEVSELQKPAGRQRKMLNLNTYKDHSLGDYVDSIRRNGTVDSYSTESVSHSFFPLCF